MTTAAQRRTGRNKPARPPADDILYPHSDGKPLGESEPHLQCIRWLLDAVEDVLRDRDEVSLHGDMCFYWEKGNPRANRAPDVMVLFGIAKDPRRLSYKVWENRGIVPAVIIETASADQEKLLLGQMKSDYERVGVREYFVFDWSGHYLKRPLYGFRLRGRKYQAIRPDADGSMLSQQLDIKLRPQGRMLRLLDSQSGAPILTRQERLGMLQRQFKDTAAELERARELLRQAGIDPDAATGGRS